MGTGMPLASSSPGGKVLDKFDLKAPPAPCSLALRSSTGEYGLDAAKPQAESSYRQRLRWSVAEMKQVWQSKLVLLVIMPFTGAAVVLETHWWAMQVAPVAIWTVGSSLLLGLIAWRLRAATPWGAAAGTAITASLMFSTVVLPYAPWHTALVPVLAVAMLAFLSTLLGRGRKEQLGTAEDRHGRSASQVSANLGVAALMSSRSEERRVGKEGRS